MKDIFTYMGIIALSLFSFYYTDKVVNIFKGNDPIMLEIMSASEEYNIPCYEGIVTSEGVILGVKGKRINKIESYNNMKAIGYDDSLLVFEEIECNITKEKTLDKYILRGNESKNGVSIIIDIEEGNIEEYNNLSLEKNINFTYLVHNKELKKYKDKLLIKKGNSVIYGGNSSKSLKEYIKFMKKNEKIGYCMFDKEENLELCSKEKINVIKSDNYLENKVYSKGKEILKSGEFIIIKDTKENVEELRILINFIQNKGYKILAIEEHLA